MSCIRPLYRQEQEYSRTGVPLSRQTMSNWLLKATALWLQPVYERMKAELLKQDILHADETTLQALNEPGKKAQSKSYMWLYRTGRETPQQLVLFEYRQSRRAEHPEEFLKNYRGYLHADGYTGYYKLPHITVMACWAHARRPQRRTKPRCLISCVGSSIAIACLPLKMRSAVCFRKNDCASGRSWLSPS